MWSELITSISINYKIDALGTYIGDGTRVFVENPNGTVTDLPAIGSSFEDIATSTTYNGINLQTITINHTHKRNGNGRTATLNYSSNEIQKQDIDKDEYGSYTGTIKVINKESKSHNATWAWYKGGLGNAAGFGADVANSFGVSGQSLVWQIPNGTFKKRYYADTDNEFNTFKSEFVNVAGKINTTAFEGFDIGNVLLQSFDASKEFVNGNEKWVIYCNYSWQIIPGITQDCYQYIPSTEFINGEKFNRPVLVERSDGAGIVTNKSLLYGYADLADFDNDWS